MTKSRELRPGSPAWYASVSYWSPWGFVGAGMVLIVAGVVMIVWAAEMTPMTVDEFNAQGSRAGQILLHVAGLIIASFGSLLSLVGAIAEGVRVGTLYARHQ